MFFKYTPLEYNNMRLAKLREFPGGIITNLLSNATVWMRDTISFYGNKKHWNSAKWIWGAVSSQDAGC